MGYSLWENDMVSFRFQKDHSATGLKTGRRQDRTSKQVRRWLQIQASFQGLGKDDFDGGSEKRLIWEIWGVKTSGFADGMNAKHEQKEGGKND